jgi:hypothetical protein
MLSKLKNMPGVAWLVIGVCVTALVMPTAAFAAGITFNGIEGQNKLKADVTAQGQLETSPADLNSAFAEIEGLDDSSTALTLYTPPSGEAAVITSFHVDAWDLSGSDPYVQLFEGTGGGSDETACSGTTTLIDEVDPTADGVTVLPYSPGYVIPAGGSLCALNPGSDASVAINGYLVPAADAPSSIPLTAGASTPLTRPTS